jgi:hypothetical protein
MTVIIERAGSAIKRAVRTLAKYVTMPAMRVNNLAKEGELTYEASTSCGAECLF